MTSLLVSPNVQPNVVPLDLVSLTVLPEPMTIEQFYEFCRCHPELRLERSATGEVSVMPPAFAATGGRNGRVVQQLANWSDLNSPGEIFDSSAGFTLPNGAIRSPDAAWISADRWDSLTEDQRESFTEISPDFVIELRSSSDTLKGLKEKMDEYMANGVRLGLLLDRQNRNVYLYRPGQVPELLKNPERVSCEPDLPGFQLNLSRIW